MGRHRSFLWWNIYTTVVKLVVWEVAFKSLLAVKRKLSKGKYHGSRGWKL